MQSILKRLEEDPVPREVWDRAVEKAGGSGALADLLDLHRNTISAYRRDPTKDSSRQCAGHMAKAVRPELRELLG